MNREDCRINMPVLIGRTNGLKTKGQIIKLNPQTAKVRTLESRNNFMMGTIINVAYALMYPMSARNSVQNQSNDLPVKVAQSSVQADADVPLTFSAVDNAILKAINECYSELSPENLTCDGEANPVFVKQRYNKLHNQLNHLFAAFGRQVSEEAADAWLEKYNKTYVKKKSTS